MQHTVVLNNFLCHTDLSMSFAFKELTLLRGNTGVGKTAIIKAVAWCLYGDNTDIVPNSNTNLSSSVTISCTEWQISRSTNPTAFIVTFDGENITDQHADAWIYGKFGRYQFWDAACVHALRGTNPLLQSTYADRLDFLRDLAFVVDEDCAVYFEKITSKLNSLSESIRRKNDVLKHLRSEQALAGNESGVDTLQTVETLDWKIATIKQELDQTQPMYNEFLNYVKQLDSLTAEKMCLPTLQLTEEELAKYQTDYLSQWCRLLENTKNQYEHMLNIHRSTVTIVSIEEDINDILTNNLGIDASNIILPPITTEIEDAAFRQDTVARTMGLPTHPELKAVMWQELQADVNWWVKNESNVTRLLLLNKRQLTAIPEVVGIALEAIPYVSKRDQVVAMHALLTSINITTEAIDLPAVLQDLQTTLNRQLENNRHAKEWKYAENLFSQTKTLPNTPASTTKIRDLQEQIFQSTLSKLQCPSCTTPLVLNKSELHTSTNTTPTSRNLLQNELDALEAVQANYTECQRIFAEIRALKLDKSQRKTPVMTDAEIAQVMHQLTIIRILLMDNTIHIPQHIRQWLLQKSDNTVDETAEIAGLMQTYADVLSISTEKEQNLHDVFASWWLRGSHRIYNPETFHHVLQIKLPDFVELPDVTMSQYRVHNRLQSLRVQHQKLKSEINKANNNTAVILDIPDYPVYDFLVRDYLTNINTLKDMQKCLAQLESIIKEVRKKTELAKEWLSQQPIASKNQKIQTQIDEIKQKLEELVKSNEFYTQRKDSLHESLNCRSVLIAAEKIRDLQQQKDSHHKELEDTQKLLASAQLLEQATVSGVLEALVADINHVLSTMQIPPVQIELKRNHTNKGSLDTTSPLGLVFVIAERRLDNFQVLSDGTRTCVGIATALALAKTNAYPFFCIDESLTTLQSDVRRSVIDTIRTHIPNKAVVVIMQDDGVGNFDRIMQITS